MILGCLRGDSRAILRSGASFAGLLVLLMLGLLVGPRVADEDQSRLCVVNVHLPAVFGVSLNCDSPEFLRLAETPSALLEVRNTRQSRPGLIALAAALKTVFQPLAALAPDAHAERADIDSGRIRGAFAAFVPAYLAYVALNGAILLAAFFVLRRVGGDLPERIRLPLGLLLVSNDVVKAFVWSPHTQMFNILVPLLCVMAFLDGSRPMRGRVLLGWTIGTGAGLLAYGTFVLAWLALVLAILLRAWTERRLMAAAGRIAMSALGIVAPSAVWYAVVVSTTGQFYQHEIALGQVVWMAQAWQDGGAALVLTRIGGNLLDLSRLAAPQAVAPAAALLWTAAFALRQGGSTRPPALLVASACLATVTGPAFFSLTGLIEARVAYTAVPPLLALVAAFAATARAKDGWGLAAGLWVIAATQAVYTVVKDGPWS